MVGIAVDLYSAAFVARYSDDSNGDRASLNEYGLRGVVSRDEERRIRLVVADDVGYGVLTSEVLAARQGVVQVFETAPRCDDFMRDQPAWRAARPATAMVCSDLRSVPTVQLPDGLVVRPVDRVAAEAPGATTLENAVAVAVVSDPGITESAEGFARFLKQLPASVRLFAAVDEGGVARATSGCDVFDDYARVFFVDTNPAWRRRGIARAMTAEALRAAASSGARRAFLDATDVGTSVYTSLGFEVAGRLTRYSRAA